MVCNTGDSEMDVGGTIVDSGYVDENNWLHLGPWAGQSWKSIPVKYREEGDGVAQVSSVMAEINDPHCDPRSGGIAGANNMAPSYGVEIQQFKKNILPYLDYVCWFGPVPASNVNSVSADGLAYQEANRAKKCENLIQYTRCNSGTRVAPETISPLEVF